MFFPKLRRRAKWVFLALAIAFGGGFIFFGIGAGGSGIGDYFADIFNRQQTAGGADVDDARERVEKNPNDADAQLALANALQADGQTEAAITALERYTSQKPRDADAQRTLASLYGSLAAQAFRRAQDAEAEAQTTDLERTLAAQDSPFLQELTNDKVTGTLSARASERAQAAFAEAQRYAGLETSVYQRLVLLVPDDPLLFLQLGQAAESAGDNASALAAYESFLELAPDDPAAEQVKARIELLKTTAGTGSG
jgi:regulator of sirC expression with transglutaminase-like and TPR domain